ncbi:MAG: hypothetical protein D6715_07085 [Calditrichaeota bacterium]|nr:MAG: hypothetical protein D6715_07085 [Calditrichota bacterium]
MVNSPVQTRPRIRKIDLFRVFLRSFFIQSLWNFRGLISVGFGVCLFPVLKRLYPDRTDQKERVEFLRRHFKFFNAHPYMASYALGVTIRLEEEAAAGHPEACQKLERLKDLLITILGALGDQLFWATIKPASLLVGTLGLLWFQDTAPRLAILAITFLLYNVPHFYIRYLGIVDGYQKGLEVYQSFNSASFARLQRFYLVIGVGALVVLTVSLALQFSGQGWLPLATYLAAVGVAIGFERISGNFYLAILFSVIFFVFVGFLFL